MRLLAKKTSGGSMPDSEGTLKIIIPSQETETSGFKFTEPREKIEPSPLTKESDFILDYKEKNGRPYLVDWLDSRFMYERDKGDFDSLDEWINFEIKRKNYKYTTDSYTEIFNGLRKKMGLSKNLAPSEQVSKMASMIKKALDENRYFSKLGIDMRSIEEIYGSDLATT